MYMYGWYTAMLAIPILSIFSRLRIYYAHIFSMNYFSPAPVAALRNSTW